jgi:uncharacterized membrane protein
MSFERPILKLTPTKSDILLDRLSLLGLLFSWIFTIFQYSKLPSIIAIHFSSNGNADNFGDKATIFILPAIISIVLIGLSVLCRYPHTFNYMQKITKENAIIEYTKATRLIRIIKLIIVAFTVILTFDIIQSAKAGHSNLPWWIIPVFIFSMISPIIISVSLSSNNRQKHGG